MKLPHLLNTTACLLSGALAASSVFAHEGHGEHDSALDGLLHWFTQWDHFAVLAAVAVVAVALMRAKRNARGDTHARKDER